MAGSVNKVILVGNLGADPEIRRLNSGDVVANLRIATSESWRDRQSGERKDRTEWHRVSVFQRQAENCANFLAKGSLIYVEGSLQTRKWQDQQGQDRYTTEIKAQRVQFLDRKGDAPRDAGAMVTTWLVLMTMLMAFIAPSRSKSPPLPEVHRPRINICLIS